MIKRVVFLIESPLSLRDFQRFGIATLLNRGFDILVFDCCAITARQQLAPNAGFESSPLSSDKLIKFENYRGAYRHLRKLDVRHDFLISILGCRVGSLPFFFLLSRLNLDFSMFFLGSVLGAYVPSVSRPQAFASKLLRVLSALWKPRWLAQFILDRVPCEILGIRPAKHLFFDAEIGRDHVHPLIRASTHKIPVHSLDYDLYLNIRNSTNRIEKDRYVVFLDEFLCFHPDYVFQGIKITFDPEEYFRTLDRFFTWIESESGCKVIIAAHPRSDYETRQPQWYKERRVIKYKTAELVKDAELVLAHGSTSTKFAVLFRKPLCLLRSRQAFKDGIIIGIVTANHETLGAPIVNLDAADYGITDLKKLYQIDNDRYDTFIRKSIKLPGTPELPFWDIVGNFVGDLKR